MEVVEAVTPLGGWWWLLLHLIPTLQVACIKYNEMNTSREQSAGGCDHHEKPVLYASLINQHTTSLLLTPEVYSPMNSQSLPWTLQRVAAALSSMTAASRQHHNLGLFVPR